MGSDRDRAAGYWTLIALALCVVLAGTWSLRVAIALAAIIALGIGIGIGYKGGDDDVA